MATGLLPGARPLSFEARAFVQAVTGTAVVACGVTLTHHSVTGKAERLAGVTFLPVMYFGPLYIESVVIRLWGIGVHGSPRPLRVDLARMPPFNDEPFADHWFEKALT